MRIICVLFVAASLSFRIESQRHRHLNVLVPGALAGSFIAPLIRLMEQEPPLLPVLGPR